MSVLCGIRSGKDCQSCYLRGAMDEQGKAGEGVKKGKRKTYVHVRFGTF